MDTEFSKVTEKLNSMSKKKDLDDYWKIVSKTIENSWLGHLEVDKETAKKSKGRGEVKITIAVPKIVAKKEKEDTIRNSFMYKAKDNLKQARRCEQVSHRIMLSQHADEGKKKRVRGAEQSSGGKHQKTS